mgnify:CR=1 FL=1
MREKRNRKSTKKKDYVYEFARKRKTNRSTREIQNPERNIKSPKKKVYQNPQQQAMELEIARSPPKLTTPPVSPGQTPPRSPDRIVSSPSRSTQVKVNPVKVRKVTPGHEVTTDSDRAVNNETDNDDGVNNAINKIYTSFNSGAAFSAGIAKYIQKKAEPQHA